MIRFPRTRLRRAAVGTLALCLAGCGSGTYLRTTRVGDARAVATTADLRLVLGTPIEETTTRYTYEGTQAVAASSVVTRRQVTCAEPSPDIAKAVSDAFSQSGALAAALKDPRTGLEGQGEATAAMSRSYTEAVAQMTERLATIQLLRDGLYRACEAFANGAISDTTYAVMLSRYDDTMITMLMGELAAGAFGRSLAAIGGTASGTSSARADVPALAKRLADAQQKVAQKTADVEKAEERVDTAVANDADGATVEQLSADAAGSKQELEGARQEQQAATDEVMRTLAAQAATNASSTPTAAGAIAREQGAATAEVARAMVALQQNYLDDHNVDAVKVACLTSAKDEQMRQECEKLIDFLIADHRSARPGQRSLFQEMFIGKEHDGTPPRSAAR
jgi:hypothetical protein